jgi:hypothetical protein
MGRGTSPGGCAATLPETGEGSKNANGEWRIEVKAPPNPFLASGRVAQTLAEGRVGFHSPFAIRVLSFPYSLFFPWQRTIGAATWLSKPPPW